MKKNTRAGQEEPEQYQLFDTTQYRYRAFVTDLDGPIDALVWFYNQRAGAENLIKEANNDAGFGGASVRSLGDELHPFSTSHASLQPELLSDAVQP